MMAGIFLGIVVALIIIGGVYKIYMSGYGKGFKDGVALMSDTDTSEGSL